MALGFRDSAALEVAIRSGLVPPATRDGAARVGRSGDRWIIEPERALTKTVVAKLAAQGVATDAVIPKNARAVSCWAEAVPPVRVAADAPQSLVVFVTPRVSDLLDLAAELVRLGCDRQELLVAGDRGVIRVVDPPTYSVVRAIDRDNGLRIFAPDPVGQATVWCELGYRHPLAASLTPEKGTLLLVTGDEWLTISSTGWRRLDAALELVVPGGDVLLEGALPPRRRIELRLSPSRRDVPSLWVIRSGGLAAIDRMLAYLPDDIVARITFAATAGDSPTVILRASTARQPAPDLSLGSSVEEYAPLAHIPDIYIPVGSHVEPPLRRERLRAVLDIAPREVMWLARDAAGKIRTERIAESAFEPLADWADYVIHSSAAKIEPWLRSGIFDFAPYVSSGREWTDAPPVESKVAAPLVRRASPVVDDEPDETPAEPAATKPRARVKPAPSAVVEAPAETVVDAELATLEAEFVALDAPGDAPARLALFQRLGDTYARLGRRREADLCFVRVVWESTDAAPIDHWVTRVGATADAFASALASRQPSADDIRVVALFALRGSPDVARDLHRVQRWLDEHENELDTRTSWLSRLALARLAGGDPLGLAHARDRILARLAGGLPVERELPAFLRLANRGGAPGSNSDHIATALEDLAKRYAETKRKRSTLEAPPALTNAYVHFLFAIGFGRAGKSDRARSFAANARKALADVATDPVHAYLIAAFSARVDQSIEGVAAEAALPATLGTQLAALERGARYKVDRLREASHILEPHERPDPIRAYGASLVDVRGPEFVALREMADPAKRARAIDAIIADIGEDERERPRLLDGVFDCLLELPQAVAMPLFQRAWPHIAHVAADRRAVLYADALVVVGHFGRSELVPGVLADLAVTISSTSATDLERVLRHSLRALRRIGLRDQVAELLATADQSLQGKDALRARLALATGLGYLGDRRAAPILEQAHGALAETKALAARLELARALALAYANGSLADALTGITELSNQLRDMTDNLGTNSHYCLAVLHFMESLVLGITSDDLILGELRTSLHRGRRALDSPSPPP